MLLSVRLDTTYFCWNWKHCNKIIFKCVNSTVGPIFNFFFWIKWLWVSWTVLLQCVNSDNCLKKQKTHGKKKAENVNVKHSSKRRSKQILRLRLDLAEKSSASVSSVFLFIVLLLIWFWLLHMIFSCFLFFYFFGKFWL